MNKHKFLKLLGKLDRKSLNGYDRYLCANYAKSLKSIELFHFLKPAFPDFNRAGLSIESAYQAVYQKELPKSEEKKRKQIKLVLNLFNDLLIILKEYLVFDYLKSTPLEMERVYTRVLREKQITEVFTKQLGVYEQKIGQVTEQDIWHYFRLLECKHLRYYNNITQKHSAKEKNLSAAIHALDNFYLSAKLRYAVELETRKKVVNDSSEMLFTQEIMDFMEKEGKARSDFQKLYYRSTLLLKIGSEENFHELKELISTPQKLAVTDFDLRIVFSYLVNFAASKIRHGNELFEREAFELNEIALEKEWLISEDSFSSTNFLNIVSLACILKEFEWLDEFLEQWSSYLTPETKEETLNLSQAYIAFNNNDFGLVLDLIQEISTQDAMINLRCRILKMQSYILMDDFNQDFIVAYWNTSYKFIKNNKDLGDGIKVSAINTFKLIQKILFESDSPKALKEDIQKQDLVFSRKWLIGLVDLMEKGAIYL